MGPDTPTREDKENLPRSGKFAPVFKRVPKQLQMAQDHDEAERVEVSSDAGHAQGIAATGRALFSPTTTDNDCVERGNKVHEHLSVISESGFNADDTSSSDGETATVTQGHGGPADGESSFMKNIAIGAVLGLLVLLFGILVPHRISSV